MRARAAALASGDLALLAALATVILSWVLVVPPGAGADEPGHLVRAGAVIRGDWSGEETGATSLEAHRLPDAYTVPDTCYAFRPEVPASCAAAVERTGADVVLTTRADEYQVWPHLAYGLPTLLPGPAAIWWARLGGALLVVALVGTALHFARRTAQGAGVVLALTPMAAGTFATVNPSSFAIAGAVAVWSVATRRSTWSRGEGWLFAAGWAAMSLSRRDGLVWAVLTVIVVQWALGPSGLARWRSLGTGPRLVIALSSAVTVIWGLTGEGGLSRWVALSPLALAAAELAAWAWHRHPGRAARIALAAGVAGATAVATVAALARRPDGWDGTLARAVVGQTGTHLVEAVGVLGWLDAPLPWLAVAAWLAAVGVLAAGALEHEVRRPLVAAAVLVLAVATAWIFELLHGNTTGRYWQGRYSLPLLVGVPIVLAAAVTSRHVVRTTIVAALALSNVALWSAARRWGVGVNGSLLPWDWDTPHTPLPTITVLVAHAVGTAALAWTLLAERPFSPSA